MTNNPWTNLDLSKENKILEIDKDIIKQHNKQYYHNPKRQISEIDYPEPFLGDPKSPIYILLGNPGRGGKEKKDIQVIKESLENTIRNNLNHRTSDSDFPLYFLDPKFENHSGYKWWNDAFEKLIQDENNGKSYNKRKKLANNIFIIELYGYHSESSEKRIINNKEKLKSINYSYFLIEEALKENKTIIIARSISTWLEKVKNLKNYNNCYFLGNNRGIKFSRNTIPPKPYNLIKSIIDN